jgi:hypothetical protein
MHLILNAEIKSQGMKYNDTSDNKFDVISNLATYTVNYKALNSR